MKQADGLQAFQRDVDIDKRLIGADGAVNLRIDAEMLATSDPCTNDLDPANVVAILPASGIAFDIDLNSVKSLITALKLLPRRTQILLPANQALSEASAQTALHLAALMIAHGREPIIQTSRDDSAVAIRIRDAEGDSATQNAAVLEHDNGKLDIVIDPQRDIVALTRLWQLAPATIIGSQATASRSSAPATNVQSTFRGFSQLPPAQNIRQTGEWTLNFPLIAEDGRLTESAVLKLAVAPDWSDDPPIATVYLNGQLVTASRINVGDNDIRFALPPRMLNFNNTLRVVVERANERRDCVPPTGGHAVQIMPGSGVTFGNESGTGFARIAHRLAAGGVVILPKQSRDPNLGGRYILLAARVLAAFGSNDEAVRIAFGSDEAKQAPNQTAIIFETAGAEGLQIPIPSRAEWLNLQPASSPALVGLFAEPDGSRLRVVLSKPDQVPDPRTLYLRGGGTNALISAEGVVWHDAPTTITSAFDGLYASASDLRRFLERYGWHLAGAFILLFLIIILGRRMLVAYFRGRGTR